MNRALLIHFLGFYAINSCMPAWALSADADILAVWYASFSLIDAIALLSIARGPGLLIQISRYALGSSMAWSAALSVEMFMLQDTLQQADISMQRYFDVILGMAMIFGVIKTHRNKIKDKAHG